MITDTLVVDVRLDFLVGLKEVGSHLAAVRRHGSEDHDLSWMFGPSEDFRPLSNTSRIANEWTVITY
uniref:Uncharacterized protein n=1 Tax=Lepeophtheirus salmonis TaxID=72036 RepID=A0A0K2TUI3_LEPSM